MSLSSSLVAFLMIEPQIQHRERPINFKENVFETIEAFRKNKATKIIASKCIIHAAPSFASAYSYFLIGVFNFSHRELTIRQIGSELSILAGILSLNFFFKYMSRSKVLKLASVCLTFINFALIPFLFLLKDDYVNLRLLVVIANSGFYNFFFEMIILPMKTIFIEICPPESETFFMSIIAFIYHLSRSLGLFLGSMLIYYLNVDKTHLDNFYLIVFAHFVFIFFACCLLLTTRISNSQKSLDRSGFLEIEISNRSCINKIDSFVIHPRQAEYGSIDEEPEKLLEKDRKYQSIN